MFGKHFLALTSKLDSASKAKTHQHKNNKCNDHETVTGKMCN